MKLRVLNAEGSRKFEEFINKERAERSQFKPHYSRVIPTPHDLLTDPQYSEDYRYDLDIDQTLVLERKRDLIVPLIDLFKNVPLADLQSNKPLWDWISLCYFDQLQPGGQGYNISRVSRAEHYVFDPDIPANGYIRQRHRIYTPFMIYRIHGGEVAPVIFHGLATATGDIMERISANHLGNYPDVLRTIHALYFDESGNGGRGYKRGTAGDGQGSVRRFTEVVTEQLQRIVDVYSMPWETLIDRLPSPEFDGFKESLAEVPEIGPYVAPDPSDPPESDSPDEPEEEKIAILVVKNGESSGNTISLDDKDIVLGRTTESDHIFDHKYVSARHCRISFKDGDHSISDLDSRNGTFVNDVRLDQGDDLILNDGDSIGLARRSVQLEFQYTSEVSDPSGTGAPPPVSPSEPPTFVGDAYHKFRLKIAEEISSSIGKKMEPLSSGINNTFWESEDARTKILIKVSKYAEEHDYDYWYTCSQRELHELQHDADPYMVLGLGDSLTFYSLDFEFFSEVLEKINPRPGEDPPTWDIRLLKNEYGELSITTRNRPVSIKEYLSFPKKDAPYENGNENTAPRYHIAYKRLTSVEVTGAISNQHELNGTSAMRKILGEERLEQITIPVKIRRSGNSFPVWSTITWYDARENNPDRTEWRLYYDENLDVSERDLMLIIRDTESPELSLEMLIVEENDPFEQAIFEILPIITARDERPEVLRTDVQLFNLM